MSDFRLVSIVASGSGAKLGQFIVEIPQNGVFSELAASVAAHSLFPGLIGEVCVIDDGNTAPPKKTAPDWANHSQPAWRA